MRVIENLLRYLIRNTSIHKGVSHVKRKRNKK